MRKIPDTNVIRSRNAEMSPSPNVYVGLNVLMCAFAPWMWRKKLFTITAVLDLSDVGLPPLRKEPRKESLMVMIFSLRSLSPDSFDSFIITP